MKQVSVCGIHYICQNLPSKWTWNAPKPFRNHQYWCIPHLSQTIVIVLVALVCVWRQVLFRNKQWPSYLASIEHICVQFFRLMIPPATSQLFGSVSQLKITQCILIIALFGVCLANLCANLSHWSAVIITNYALLHLQRRVEKITSFLITKSSISNNALINENKPFSSSLKTFRWRVSASL